jgi:Sec-independent protein translocase protein TatA
MLGWGELAFLTGVGLFVIGKRDLPRAANFAGTQVGRLVGLIQGARARADRYAEQSELRQLQNELRSGLRELDAVRSELAVSVSGGSRVLGAMTPNVNRTAQTQWTPPPPPLPGSSASMALPASSSSLPADLSSVNPSVSSIHVLSSSTVQQSKAAVAEAEWVKRGMGYQSAAERGSGITHYKVEQSGSAILSTMLQESLIFDQYDRVVSEQDAALQSKVAAIQEKYQKQKQQPQAVNKETTNVEKKD